MHQMIKKTDGRFKVASRSTVVTADAGVAMAGITQTSKPDPYFAIPGVVIQGPQTVAEDLDGHRVSITF